MKTLDGESGIDAPTEAMFEFCRTMDEPRSLAWHPEHDAFENVEFRTTHPLWRFCYPKRTFAFEPVGDGTRFVAENHFRIGPPPGRSAHVRQSFAEIERHVHEEGTNLKRLVETGTASAVSDRAEPRPCRGAGEP